jgi:hypothetical protein
MTKARIFKTVPVALLGIGAIARKIEETILSPQPQDEKEKQIKFVTEKYN